MKTFAINTLGCKVNQYESQQIRELLEGFDLCRVELPDNPDLVVVNTCCVTHIASSKSRQYIRKAQKSNPQCTVVVAGCLPVGQRGELANIDGDVHFVSQKSDLPSVLVGLIEDNNVREFGTPCPATSLVRKTNRAGSSRKIKNKSADVSRDGVGFSILKSYSGQSRAFLKIQDGCDGFCTYCIVSRIRTEIYNKPSEEVIQEAHHLIYAGHREIVLTGIFLGGYGQETVRRRHWEGGKNKAFVDLIEELAQVAGLERLRLSSLEPGDVTDELLDVFCRHRNIVPHLHLPLQSGSESVLKRMCRQYTVSEFLDTAAKVKGCLDRPGITTDIIVGFPGETDDDFARTVEAAQQVGFAKMHVFSFSRRKGTPAAKMEPVVPSEVIKHRSQVLRDLDEKLQGEFRRQFGGEEVGVIIEDVAPDGGGKGRCERYFMVEIEAREGESVEKGDLVYRVLDADGCKGE